jgi:hypothetical protein
VCLAERFNKQLNSSVLAKDNLVIRSQKRDRNLHNHLMFRVKILRITLLLENLEMLHKLF